ncbi:MAG: efflux RND transporter periplasmic adaptor subunit [Pseudomonadota bacterium]
MAARHALTLGLLLGALPLHASAQGGPPPVDVATPIEREIVDFAIYTGRFEAVERVEIRARVSGYLEAVSFEDGAEVAEGDLLFTIDQRTFQAQVARAEARLAQANAARDLARIEQARAEQLAARNVGTEQDVDRTTASLAEAEAEVAVAEAELRQAELDLDFTEIRAPVAGRLSSAYVDAGNLVVGGAANATLLSTVVSTDPIHFIFTVSEGDFLRFARVVRSGDRPSPRTTAYPAAVRLMDEDTFVHEGSVDFIDNTLDPNSGTIQGRAMLENGDGFLVPGVFGRIRLPASEPYVGLLVPDEAIQADQSRRVVMVVAEDGTVSQRFVETGPLREGMRVIRSGLERDERIVVNGLQRARPGQKVTPEVVELARGE